MGEAGRTLDMELRTSHWAPWGGTVHRRKRHRTIPLVGEVTFPRSRGRCHACGAVVYWVDREWGIDAYQRRSPGVEELKALWAASWGSQRSAEGVSRVTGTTTSAMAVPRTVTPPGQEEKPEVRDPPSPPTVAETVRPIMVDADGVMVHSRDPVKGEGDPRRWMAGKVVCVWSAQACVGRDRDALVAKRYSATFPSRAQMAPPRSQDVFNRARARYPAQQVVVSGDGGAGIRPLYPEWCSRGRLLGDAYPLRKTIQTRLREALRPSDPDRTTESHRRYQALVTGHLTTAAHHVRQLTRQTTRLRAPVALRKLDASLHRHQEGRWDPQARAEGIDIGTGAIENAGDLVICRRFTFRGMRGSRSGADAL
jgi:hypothetical protein